MFKLVVLCAFFAVAAAEPSTLIVGPTAYSTVIAPGTTTITKQASSVVHPSPPLIYSSPLAYTHFIKKRSVAAFPYAASYYGNIPTTYYSGAPLATYNTPLATTYNTPLAYNAPLYQSAQILPAAAPFPYSAAHLIKKRSAPFFPTYYTPTTYAASSPILTSPYAAASIHPAPLISSAPLISHPITYSPHYIKKRSAPLLTTYAALPSSYSHQSRVDYTHASPYVTTYSSPLVYSSPIGYSHVL